MEYKKDTFEQIYNSYSKILYNLIFSYTKNKYDSEDILQDTFITYINKMDKIKDENILYWLIRVSKNKTINYLKKKSKEVVNDEIISYSYENDNEDKEDTKIVFDLITKLDSKYKDVIVMYYYNDYSIDQISKSLSLSLSCVKMRLKRGKELLKERLEKTNVR